MTTLLKGIKEMAEYLRVSESFIKTHVEELKKGEVIIEKKVGRPPNRRKWLYADPLKLIDWFWKSS